MQGTFVGGLSHIALAARLTTTTAVIAMRVSATDFRCFECSNGIDWVQKGSTYSGATPADVDVRMVLAGSSVNIYLDGVLRITATTTVLVPGTSGIRVDVPVAQGTPLMGYYTATNPDAAYYYGEANFRAFVTGAGLIQSADWVAAGNAITCHVRLTGPSVGTTTVQVLNGATLLGTVSIGNGLVYGTGRYTVGTVGSPKDIRFVVSSAMPASSLLYSNDFTVDDLVNWREGMWPGSAVTNFTMGGGALTKVGAGAELIAPASTLSTDVDVTFTTPLASFGNPFEGPRIRCNSTGNLGCYYTASTRVWTIYELAFPNAWTLIATSDPQATRPGPDVVVRILAVGSWVRLYVDGALVLEGTTKHISAGQIGIRTQSLWTTLMTGLTVKTPPALGVESLAAHLLEADGGPKQTLDPYFNGTPAWAPNGGAVISGNVMTFPQGATDPFLQQTFATLSGETLEVRAFVEQLHANDELVADIGAGIYVRLHQGWNAVTLTNTGANSPSFYMAMKGTKIPTIDIKVHFFFAAKV